MHACNFDMYLWPKIGHISLWGSVYLFLFYYYYYYYFDSEKLILIAVFWKEFLIQKSKWNMFYSSPASLCTWYCVDCIYNDKWLYIEEIVISVKRLASCPACEMTCLIRMMKFYSIACKAVWRLKTSIAV